MEVMYQESSYLKNKYEGGEVEGWMADYLNGNDIVRKEISSSDYKSLAEYDKAV
jgi:hypothetical protein